MKATKINAMKIGKAIKKGIQGTAKNHTFHMEDGNFFTPNDEYLRHFLISIGIHLSRVFKADNPQFDVKGWMEFITHLDEPDHEA